MFLLGSRRKLTALALCKSTESAIQWFQIHHREPLQLYKIQLYTFRVQGLAFFQPWFPDYVPIQCTLRFIWVHAKVVLNIRWAHISLYSFCHVQHHILVQAKFNEYSVKIADFLFLLTCHGKTKFPFGMSNDNHHK